MMLSTSQLLMMQEQYQELKEIFWRNMYPYQKHLDSVSNVDAPRKNYYKDYLANF